MLLIPLLNSSWNTKLILAPPESSFNDKSLVLPSMVVRNSEVNSVMTDNTMLPEFPSAIGPPRVANSALAFCSFDEIAALISGSELRMWCIRIWANFSNTQTAHLSCLSHHVELPGKEWGTAKLSLAFV